MNFISPTLSHIDIAPYSGDCISTAVPPTTSMPVSPTAMARPHLSLPTIHFNAALSNSRETQPREYVNPIPISSPLMNPQSILKEYVVTDTLVVFAILWNRWLLTVTDREFEELEEDVRNCLVRICIVLKEVLYILVVGGGTQVLIQVH